MEWNKKAVKHIVIGAMACILLYWVLHETVRVAAALNRVMAMIRPFVIGAGLAFVLNVPMRSIEKLMDKYLQIRGKRGLSIVATFVAVVCVFGIVIGLLVPQIEQTILTIAAQLPPFVQRVQTNIQALLAQYPEVLEWVMENTQLQQYDWAGLAEQALDVLGQGVSKVFGSAVSAVGSVFSAIWNVFISLIFAIYCLSNKETLARQIRRLLYAFLPEKNADETIRVARLTNRTFSNFISGQCLEMVILGLLFAVAMSIFGMPHVALVSVLVAVTAFIPVVGAWIGCILGAFFILVNDPMQALWFIVMFLILQQIENNLIYPRVVGSSIGLPSMWVLAAVTIGGDLMGVAGMLLMIPFASVMYTLLREFAAKRVAQRNIPAEKLQSQPMEVKSMLKEKREQSKKKREAKRAAKLAEMMKQTLHIPDHSGEKKTEE